MESPKPKPPVQKTTAKQSKPARKKPAQAEQVKKANFKLKAHLTHRPFSDDALFAKLREQGQANKEGHK